jgi:hypothetical protein
VCDNNSDDQTYEHAFNKYGLHDNIEIYKNNQNLGRVGNWNKLLDIASSRPEKFLKFVFDGEEIFPNCIEECSKVIGNYPDLAAIVFNYEFINANGGVKVSPAVKDTEGFLNNNKVLSLNHVQGGFLGSIVANVYSKKAIGDIRFNEHYVSKTDFDFEVLNNKSAYYLNKTLARTYVTRRNTYFKTLDFWFESENVFLQTKWLEKQKEFLPKEDYLRAREIIYLTFFERNRNNFSTGIQIKLFKRISMNILQLVLIIIIKKIIPNKLLIKLKKLMRY